MADAPTPFPPDEWFAAVADGRPQHVACRDIEGGVEPVAAQWSKAHVFYLPEIPPLADTGGRSRQQVGSRQ